MKMAKNEIAVRLYENKKYGTTYGKGLYHSAVFNASAEVLGKNTKYLLDFYPYERWQHTARSNEQMELLDIVSERANADTLVSWVIRYDPISKMKTPVIGYAFINLASNELDLAVIDEDAGVQSRWQLTAKPCKQRMGVNSPTLLATNADDLGQW